MKIIKKIYYRNVHGRPLILPGQNIGVLTNGKCGGTSLHRWYFDQLQFRPEEMYSICGWKKYRLFFFLYHALRLETNFLSPKDEDFRVFVKIFRRFSKTGCHWDADTRWLLFCRNPYDRAVSVFLEKMCTTENKHAFVRDLLESIALLKKIRVDDVTFMDYLEFLRLKREELCSLNGHFAPQVCIISKMGVRADPVRIENFSADMTSLGYGDLAVNLDKRNSLHKVAASDVDTDFSKLGINSVVAYCKAHNGFPSNSLFLSSEAKHLIRETYFEDFAELPYEPV